MLSNKQLRAARGMLGWSQKDLANASEVSLLTIQKYEAGLTDSRYRTILKMREALQEAGILFIEKDDIAGEGVRFSSALKE